MTSVNEDPFGWEKRLSSSSRVNPTLQIAQSEEVGLLGEKLGRKLCHPRPSRSTVNPTNLCVVMFFGITENLSGIL